MAPANTLQRATLIMVALATMILQLALWNAQQRPWLQFGELACAVVVALAAGRWLRWEQRGRIHPLMVVSLIVLWLMPPIAEPLLRGVFGIGNPWELLVVVSLRNTMLGLAAVRNHPACQRLACCASFFLTLFAFMLQFNFASSVLVGLYAIVAMWWLIGSYWERLSGKMPATAHRHLPRCTTLLAVSIVGIVAIVAGVVLERGEPRRILAGVFPSSGGEAQGDRFAQGGIGDGEQLVSAAFDASSFGPVESDVLLDSELPSLYDMFDESYGDPPKPDTERAIALEYQERDDCERQTATTMAGRSQFSTVRQRRHVRRELDDRQSAAMLYVVGRSPTHLALETYDTFDGVRWFKSDVPRFHSNLELETVGDEPWLRMKSPTRQLFAKGYEAYTVKIINLETTRFPSPPHLARVHIDKVDRLEFYGWSNEGILEMPNREAIPRLAVIHLRALQPLRRQISALGDFRTLLPARSDLLVQFPNNKEGPKTLSRQERLAYELAPYYQLPPGSHPADDLSHEWVSDEPAGWPQVQAIVAGLRNNFVHDPDATAPVDCEDVVAHFLAARRGPDYMFATTAAVMLRRHDYPTRLVGGFYSDPKRYDHVAGETSVLGEDVHVWAEVCIDGIHWMPIEPTPGYQPPPESLTTVQWAVGSMWTAVDWLVERWLFLASLTLFLASVLAARRPLTDGIAWLLWWALGRGSAMNRVRWTVWLLERRAALAGRRRPDNTTFSRWCTLAARGLPESAAGQMHDFARACDNAFYGQGRLRDDTAELCRTAVRCCRRRTFQQLGT